MNVPLNIDFQQILLHLFNFGILFAGLYFILYKPVKDFMEKRSDHYKAMDEAADEVMAKANALKDKYEKKMLSVEDDYRVLKNEIEKKAIESSSVIVEDARKKADKIIEESRNLAEAQKARILESAREDIAVLAAEAAEKIVADALEEGRILSKGASDE